MQAQKTEWATLPDTSTLAIDWAPVSDGEETVVGWFRDGKLVSILGNFLGPFSKDIKSYEAKKRHLEAAERQAYYEGRFKDFQFLVAEKEALRYFYANPEYITRGHKEPAGSYTRFYRENYALAFYRSIKRSLIDTQLKAR